MSHLKRVYSPYTWPVTRKGTKYLTRPYPGQIMELSMSLNVAIRDLLKISSNRKETKIMLNMGEILVNGKAVKTEKFPVGIFDIISLPRIKKNYKLFVNEKKRFDYEEVNESEIRSRVFKVINKTSLIGNKMQLNFLNGKNIISDDKKIKVNDSVKIDTEKNKVLSHLPVRTGSKVYIVGGKHLGSKGIVGSVADSTANVKIGERSFDIKMKNVYVTN